VQVDILHRANEREDIQMVLELPRGQNRGHRIFWSADTITAFGQAGATPILVPLSELVRLRRYCRQDHLPQESHAVTYIIGDVRRARKPGLRDHGYEPQLEKLDMTGYGGSDAQLRVLNASQPFSIMEPALKWDGEWHITIEVFRDLGWRSRRFLFSSTF